jgi:UDP-glucose 4-epimerase
MGWRTRRSLADICRDGWAWQRANPEGYRSDSDRQAEPGRALIEVQGVS